MFKKLLATLAVSAMTLTAPALQARNIDLGFIMDRSGSVGGQFPAAMDALAAALANNIPIPGEVDPVTNVPNPDTYTISVVSFAEGASVVVAATVIDSQADLDAVVATISAVNSNGSGLTNYAAALTLLGAQFGTLGDDSLINMMTDGQPNRPGGSAAAEVAAQASATALENAGWDSLSFESVGNASGDALLADLGFGGPGGSLPIYTDVNQIGDPLTAPFVLSLDNFAEYNAVIGQKVRFIVEPPPGIPTPATLPLIGLGLLMLGFAGRRRKAA